MFWNKLLNLLIGIIAIALIDSRMTLAQGSYNVLSSGYIMPDTTAGGARGQIITIFVTGISNRITQIVKAEQLPLPVSLAGVAIRVDEIPLPIMFIEPSGIVTVITAQIPYELVPWSSPFHSLVILIEGREVYRDASFNLMANSAHLLRTCDTIFLPRTAKCSPMVTRADGSLVSSEKPALPGETLSMHAVGLGVTNPVVKTGEATPAPPPVLSAILMSFDFSPNAPPKDIRTASQEELPKPIFAGLVPGQVGIYRIDFQVPNVPRTVQRCADSVRSNMTVNIAIPPTQAPFIPTPGSFDGVGICVDPKHFTGRAQQRNLQ